MTAALDWLSRRGCTVLGRSATEQRSRRQIGLVVATVVSAAAVGLSAEWAYHQAGGSAADVVRDATVGWAFVATGLVALLRQPAGHIGRLMVMVGFAWFLGNFQSLGPPIVFSLSYWLEPWNMGLLAHLVLAFPRGGLAGLPARALAIFVYALIGVFRTLDVATYDSASDTAPGYLCGKRCPPNALVVVPNDQLNAAIGMAFHALAALAAVAIFVIVARRWLRSTAAGRRGQLPVWIAMLAVVLFVVEYTGQALDPHPSGAFAGVLLWSSDLAQLAIPIAFLLGLLRVRLARGAVGELVIEMGQAPPPARLREALARTLGDRSLELAFWVDDVRSYVTPEGMPVNLPQANSARMVTLIEQQGRRHAALVHDRALADDRRLVQAVQVAARLGLENERLHAELSTRLEEVRASRVRILEAGDAERRRIERNLHDGAQQRLLSVALTLREALSHLGDDPDPRARDAIRQAMLGLRLGLADIRELARGIHPAILVQDGLAAAVTSLAEAAALPVVVRIPPGRYPMLVESTAYYIISEAVANAVRHSRASWVEVVVRGERSWLVVEVADDGIGGVSPTRGTGIQGLVDRTAALGGRLDIRSTPGHGTRVRAELPKGGPQLTSGTRRAGDGEDDSCSA